MSIKTKIFGGVVASALLIATPFIAKHEGLRTSAYLDIAKVPTICYGSTVGVKMGDVKTKKECDDLLKKEVEQFMKQTYDSIKVEVSPQTLSALTSFSYNVGIGAFRNSTLLRTLNSGDVPAACLGMMDWVCITVPKGTGDIGGLCHKADRSKQFSRGLFNRRKEEVIQCLQ